ncbi:hypothetical protein FORC47_4447 [Bacillus cereus]|nr:hypothetical protein FORC47_4447 [Bacillus cereus]
MLIPSFKFNLISTSKKLKNIYQIRPKALFSEDKYRFIPYILIIITCDTISFCLYFRLSG